MNSLFLISILITFNIVPQNPMFDKYTIIPALGYVKALAVSPGYLCALSDNYLIILDKIDLNVEKTFLFDEDPLLVGYDQYSNDLWVITVAHLFRISLPSFSIREYDGTNGVTRLGIDDTHVYLDGIVDRALNKRTSMLEPIKTWPGHVTWYRKTTDSDIMKYPYLTPYFYYDETPYTDTPFAQYPITAVYDDGMDLYVGTLGYGLLKYNTVSWFKQRIVYGPLDLNINKVRAFNNNTYFISAQGISQYPHETSSWEYHRFSHPVNDMQPWQNGIIFGMENRLATQDVGVTITLGTFNNKLLALSHDDTCLYIGTRSGMYKLYHGTTEPIDFGPDRFPVHTICVTSKHIFAGGEFALYGYDLSQHTWSKILPFGVKKITQIDQELYLLSTNNQLIRYAITDTLGDIDTNWVLLPYFNIYDIAADERSVYCASYAGAHYYDPETDSYRVIYNLPRIQYRHVFIVEEDIIVISDNAIYSLPKKYRD